MLKSGRLTATSIAMHQLHFAVIINAAFTGNSLFTPGK